MRLLEASERAHSSLRTANASGQSEASQKNSRERVGSNDEAAETSRNLVSATDEELQTDEIQLPHGQRAVLLKQNAPRSARAKAEEAPRIGQLHSDCVDNRTAVVLFPLSPPLPPPPPLRPPFFHRAHPCALVSLSLPRRL